MDGLMDNGTVLTQVSRDEATAKAREWGVPYLETSAKTKMNVDEAYYNLLRQVRVRCLPVTTP
jgi:Ras-related protein Ral-A